MKGRLVSALIVTIVILAGSVAASLYSLPQTLARRLAHLPPLAQQSRSRASFIGLSPNWHDEQRDAENINFVFDSSMSIGGKGTFSQPVYASRTTVEHAAYRTTSSQLYVEKIESLDALLALEPEWTELHRVSGSTLPFNTFAWAYHWWRHFREERLSVRDTLSIFVVRKLDGEAVAIAPMMLTAHPGVGPVRFKFLQFLGADPNLTEIRGPLLHPAFEGAALRSLIDKLEASAGAWNWIKWNGIRAASVGAAVIGQSRSAEVSGECSDYLLPLAPSWDEFRNTRKRNIRESLRKCYHSLARDGHSFAFSVARTPDEIEASLPIFFKLHTRRAQQPGTIPHADYFGSATARNFLRDVCLDMAKSNRARIFTLSVGGSVVAARIGFLVNGSLYLYYSGYDPDWGKYSVMTTLVAESIKYAIANGCCTVGLSTGKDVSKTRWGPQAIVYNDYLHISASFGGLLAYRLYSAAHRVRKRQPVLGMARRSLYRRSDG